MILFGYALCAVEKCSCELVQCNQVMQPLTRLLLYITYETIQNQNRKYQVI